VTLGIQTADQNARPQKSAWDKATAARHRCSIRSTRIARSLRARRKVYAWRSRNWSRRSMRHSRRSPPPAECRTNRNRSNVFAFSRSMRRPAKRWLKCVQQPLWNLPHQLQTVKKWTHPRANINMHRLGCILVNTHANRSAFLLGWFSFVVHIGSIQRMAQVAPYFPPTSE